MALTNVNLLSVHIRSAAEGLFSYPITYIVCLHPSTGSKSSLFEVIQQKVLYDLPTQSIGTTET